MFNLQKGSIIFLLIGVILFLASSGSVLAQSPPHVIVGVVKDSTGNVIESGRITAWLDLNGNLEQISSSGLGEGGKFTLLVEETGGVSFTGKAIKFKVDGLDTATDLQIKWAKGMADVIQVAVLPAPEPTPEPTLEPTPEPISIPVALPTNTPVPPAPVAPAAVPVPPTMVPQEPGFRENPTTRLRPVNDQITADQDGIVEIFMVNPTVNDVSMTVDMIITVPAGIHVYGEGFSCAGGGAGACAGSFTINPGQSKTGHLNVKAEKVGPHQVHFSGYWWPGNNKDLRQPISLTHPFNVSEPSKNIGEESTVPQQPTAEPPSKPSAGCNLAPVPVGEGNSKIPLGTLAVGLGIVGLCVRRFI